MHARFPVKSLLNSELSEEAINALFSSLGFNDWLAAFQRIKKISGYPDLDQDKFSQALPNLLFAFSTSPDADSALINFERFLLKAEPGITSKVLESSPRHLEILIKIFSSSQYLSEILLNEPASVEILLDQAIISQVKDLHQMITELEPSVSESTHNDPLTVVHRFYKRELLRIGAGDLTASLDLATVTHQLTTLAEAIIQTCLGLACESLKLKPDQFVILGMGKLGGEELNYSSDIDLLFLTEGDDPNLTKAGQILIDLLTKRTDEGFLYRVDMRLRPWGRAGSLVSTFEGYYQYLTSHAKNWEKQALIKARPIAGDLVKGADFLLKINEVIYHLSPDIIKQNVYQMKARTEEILRENGRGWGEIKLGQGSIRDVEFVTQYLQLIHGGKNHHLRKRSTLQAIRRLHKYGIIPTLDFRILTDGYIFLRTIEHFLQLMHYQQTHTLPDSVPAIQNLARRLGFDSTEFFLQKYTQNSQAIRAIFENYLSSPVDHLPAQNPVGEILPFVRDHIARMSQDYLQAFNESEINVHALLAEKINKQNPGLITAEKISSTHWKVTIVALDFLGELSIFCGLFFLYGLNIQSGDIFTYQDNKNGRDDEKIVDVFIVESLKADINWDAFEHDVKKFLLLIQEGQLRIARSQLAIRIGTVFENLNPVEKPLLPIELSFDNQESDEFTIIQIKTADTIGFLYEFTNALSLLHIDIDRMIINTQALQVEDHIYVTDDQGRKITDKANLQRLRSTAVLIKHFTHLLPSSPNPAKALLNFRELLVKLFEQEDWEQGLAALEKPQVIDNLARLLGISDFLWDDFIRMQYENLFPVIKDTESLAASKSREQLQAEISGLIQPLHNGPQLPGSDDGWKTVLNEFKDREMFRIDMRHILGLTQEFWDFSRELTDLTEVIINVAFHLTFEDLRLLYGTPRDESGAISQMTVLALGKCGGRELGFASDIELMFIYASEGNTDGADSILNSIFYEKLVGEFLKTITAKHEGIFHIDLRLRPYGNAGSLAVALNAFQKYFRPGGPAWPYERQSLVKLRPIAGDKTLGQKLENMRDKYVYKPAQFDVIAMRAMREQQVRHLTQAGLFNAKYSPGGLIDVEYLVQGLQILNSINFPSIRGTNVRDTLFALNKVGIISEEEFTKLRKAHTFLRWLIDSMRVVRGNSKDVNVPPFDSEEFSFLSRRLRFGKDHQKLIETIARVQADVVELNRKLLPVKH